MKAQLVAALFAVAACTNAQTSNAVPRVPARGELLVDEYTPETSTDTAAMSQAEKTGATTTTSAHVRSTEGVRRENDRAAGDLPRVHETTAHVVPHALPVSRPHPSNPGDPCGWCR
jgi:hypothetical protein